MWCDAYLAIQNLFLIFLQLGTIKRFCLNMVTIFMTQMALILLS